MSCSNCCGTQNTTNCNSPCATSATNTAACESLSSTVDNFITHFFGTITKTEVEGNVTWALPCSLDVGLTNNPRDPSEGLACYFLRLFDEGITGLTGPTGPAGAAGTNGSNAYSVTLQSFTQPTTGSPNASVKISANPAILEGSIVFIGTSGWYSVDSIGADATLFLTLLQAASGATGTITAGKVVNVTGPRGLTGNTGGQGIQGVQGAQGNDGDEFTPTNGLVVGTGVADTLGIASALVVFGGTEPELTLPVVGEYLVEVIVGVTMDGTAATLPPETLIFKLWNATQAAFVLVADGGEETVQCFEPNERGQVRMRAIITTLAPNETLQLYGQVSVAGAADVIPTRTSLSYVRLS